MFMEYDWPGNIRELENVLERSVVIGEGNLLPDSIVLDSLIKENPSLMPKSLHGDRPTLGLLEERYIRKILEEENYKVDQAARILGISRRTLYRKEKAYGLHGDEQCGSQNPSSSTAFAPDQT
jgi:DNA-binding NtrC family response regulator